MVWRTCWMVFLLTGVFVAVTLFAHGQSPQSEGKDKGKEIVASECIQCHGLDRITSSHRTAEEWRDLVALMVANGAALNGEEIEIVVQYLAKNFGPANASGRAQEDSGRGAAQPPRQDEGKDLPEGKEKQIVARACTVCHSLERITTAHHTPEEWQDIAHRMILNGAVVKNEEAGTVVDYLVKNFGPGNIRAQAAPVPVHQGIFKPVAGVYQLMEAIIIPNSDVVWHVQEEPPKDNKEWATVQHSALTLAEAGNLLMIGTRAKDQGNWVKAAQALTDIATVVFRAAEAKNADAVIDAGDKMVHICRNCHSQYKSRIQ